MHGVVAEIIYPWDRGLMYAMECGVGTRDGRNQGTPCCMQAERSGHMVISLKDDA